MATSIHFTINVTLTFATSNKKSPLGRMLFKRACGLSYTPQIAATPTFARGHSLALDPCDMCATPPLCDQDGFRISLSVARRRYWWRRSWTSRRSGRSWKSWGSRMAGDRAVAQVLPSVRGMLAILGPPFSTAPQAPPPSGGLAGWGSGILSLQVEAIGGPSPESQVQMHFDLWH